MKVTIYYDEIWHGNNDIVTVVKTGELTEE